MSPRIFIALDAIIVEHRKVAFRSLLALRRFGIRYDGMLDEEYVCREVISELNAVVMEHAPRFVLTHIHDSGLRREHLHAHLHYVGLPTIAENLDQQWRTEAHATGISTWLAKHASAQHSFAALFSEEFAEGLEESDLAKHSIFIDGRLRAHEGIQLVNATLRHQTNRGEYA